MSKKLKNKIIESDEDSLLEQSDSESKASSALSSRKVCQKSKKQPPIECNLFLIYIYLNLNFLTFIIMNR